MVISNVSGGLGNQMFQYATGRALAVRRETQLYLDVSSFQRHSIHQGYELNRLFGLGNQLAAEENFNEVLGWQRSPLVRRILSRKSLQPFRKKSFIIEPYFEYWPGIETTSKNCYLTGYWQSERYFSDAKKTIRRDFTFPMLPDRENQKLSQQIIKHNSVSLHVRRGDYISNSVNSGIYSVCSVEYYARAIELLIQMVQKPHFFVFSDDIEWAKKNLSNIGFAGLCTFFSHNRGLTNYVDMQLMSLCQHHIIANSSFSWWGAWLNDNPRKIVIAPSKWFNKSISTEDLLPTEWLRV